MFSLSGSIKDLWNHKFQFSREFSSILSERTSLSATLGILMKMPRIDPLQLLKCLSVLLTPTGGILSKEEVPRVVNLMTKFSKKLVSKCVYVLILKVTEKDLVDIFMAEGGWVLVQTWLQDAIHVSNWDLVKEILGLLIVTPVDVERLKLNNIPKLVKMLSRKEDMPEVQKLASTLVDNWLVLVKTNNLQVQNISSTSATEAESADSESKEVQNQLTTVDVKAEIALGTETEIKNETDGVVAAGENTNKDAAEAEKENVANTTEKEDAKVPTESSEDKTAEKKSSSSSRSSSSSKDKKRSSSSSKSSSSSSSSSSRDKSRDKDRKDKDKHRSNGSSRHSSSSRSSSSSKERRSSKDKDRHRDKDKDKDKDKEKDKSKQAEKDKDTLAKLKPQSLDKVGKIPKKSDKDEKDVKKKPTMSIEVRKNREDRPKTVKIFNSKMRSTGLEEEVKPPPPRPTKKPSVQLPTIPSKRPSPPKDVISTPPEKKLKLDITDKIDRPGAIKLIPPKPKPTVLQESDIFMDALTAATTKKEVKKRKRRPSLSKETPSSPTVGATSGDQSNVPSSPVSTALGFKNIAPINFYQDTLSTETNENENEDGDNKEDDGSGTPTQEGDDEEGDVKRVKISEDGLKGVLCYTKRKGPKRSIRWRSDDDLVEVRYFELDETERVNVTKTFMDMAKMEMCGEREAVMRSRKLTSEDIMGEQTMWRPPIVVDLPDPLAVPGSKSLEKDIQFAREKSVLPAQYFDKRRIPDTPYEPDPEHHQMKDPVIIPLDDPDGTETDLRNTPWPEPKGSPPHVDNPPMPQGMFPNMPGGFNPNNFPQMPPPGFPGMPPRFPGPGGPGPNNFMPPNMMPNGNMMGPPNMGPPPDMMNQGPMNPNMFGPGHGPDGFNQNDNPNFGMPFNQPNMFPPNNFNMRGNGMRGGFRGRGGPGNGPWVRMNMPGGNWNRGGGGGHRGGRMCKNVKNHGYCRNIDNCPFIH